MAGCQLAGPLCPEHIILSKTQLLAVPRGLPKEGPCQHGVRPRWSCQGDRVRSSYAVPSSSSYLLS